MNPKIIPGLLFAIALAVFFIIEMLLTRDRLNSKEILKLIISGVFASVCAGLLLVWFTTIFGKWVTGDFDHSKFVDNSTMINLAPNEAIIYHSGSNLSSGLASASGFLYLTNERLIFKSHQLKNQNQELIIPLSAIHKIEKLKSPGLTENGFLIRTTLHGESKFIVEEIEEWLLYLQAEKV